MTIYDNEKRPRPCPPIPPCPPCPPPTPVPPIPVPIPGPMGPQGPEGPAGAIADYANFYALQPGSNPNPITPGNAVAFPLTNASTTDIIPTSSTTFTLVEPGTYLVSFRVNSVEPGQLQLSINGTPLNNTVFGQASANSEISGMSVITTTTPNSTLRVINPASNATNVTVSPSAGGTLPSASDLTIIKLK